MSPALWLRAADCPLLQPDAEVADPLWLRQLQRLLEVGLVQEGADAFARALLEEVAGALHADQVAILEAPAPGQALWEFVRRGARALGEAPPRRLPGEVVDRQEGGCQPPPRGAPAVVAGRPSHTGPAHGVVPAGRP